jgi:glyoxylase-like metal-dependent hydrolase (beta-lactamase superfamily II)
MKPFKIFTGGPLDTNSYFFETPSGNLLFDAPQGADAYFAAEKVDWLVLTHGHFDHVMDAAKIQRRHGCRVAFHPDTMPMLADGSFFKKHGFDIEYEPCASGFAPRGRGNAGSLWFKNPLFACAWTLPR